MLPVTLIALGMAASTARADDPTAEPSPAAERVTSYRKYTLTADVLSLSLMVAGGLAEGEGGRDTAASNTLMGVGSMGEAFATP